MRNELYKYNKDSLSYEKVSFKSIYGLPIVIFLIVNMFIGSRVYEPTVIEQITEVEKTVIIDEHNEFTVNKLIVEIGNMNFDHPEIVLAQTKLETGNYTSVIFKENHNLFGMKFAYRRVRLSNGTDRGHAWYDSWKHSLYDYAFYYSKYLDDMSEEEYYDYLKQNYAEDPSYIKKVKKIANEYKQQKVFWHYKDAADQSKNEDRR